MAVSAEALEQPWHVRVLDETSLMAHLSMIGVALAVPGTGCTQDRVLLSVRCVGEVLLQVAPRLLVRAAAQELFSAAQPAGMS